MKVKSGGNVIFFNEKVKKQHEFEKRFGLMDEKLNGNKLLDIYNKYLNEFFNAKEPYTNANRSMIKSIRNILNQDFNVKFEPFVKDVITNWEYYQNKFFSAKGVPFPFIKYILGNITIFANLFKNRKKDKDEVEKW